ncbi:MAG: hypothetical protein ACXV3F_02285 [Frankiaceae bacterium]
MVDAGAEQCWELTVPADDAELLAELRRHGVRPGRRLRLIVSDQIRPDTDARPEFFASYAGAADASERRRDPGRRIPPRPLILVDTGPLVAAANRNDRHHHRSTDALRNARPPRLVPAPVVAEACHLLARDAGAHVEAMLLRAFPAGYLAVADLIAEDLARAATSSSNTPTCRSAVSTPASSQSQSASGSEIVTLDVRHFSVVRPAHVRAFTLCPYRRWHPGFTHTTDPEALAA